MTNYREVLRLSSLGLNKVEIAQSCGCSRNTVDTVTVKNNGTLMFRFQNGIEI